tara:strand:+ start:136 stop:555 length:420 start_codon:yes stop_codon:yes gene_type:complete
MKKEELKKILRPLIKECVKEVIFEDGTLSTIISEVLKGTSQQLVTESKQPQRKIETDKEAFQRRERLLKEQRKKMLDAIGRDSYNGVDLFEGTTPAPPTKTASSAPHGSGALDGVSPKDPGVDITSFGTSGIWKKLAGN